MRRATFVVAVVALAIAAWAVSCVSLDKRRGHSAHAAVPGVVVICLDTLRADAVDESEHGSGLPSLRTWARGSTTFTDALAPSSWTPPSVTSLLTGLETLDHGVIGTEGASRLPDGVPTLASILRDAGWSTWASTGGGWVTEGSGLASGFDRFMTNFDQVSPEVTIRRWKQQRRDDRPFFLFLHSYASHDPYGDKRAAASGGCRRAGDPDEGALANRLRTVTPAELPPLIAPFLLAWLADPCSRRVIDSAMGEAASTRLWTHSRGWIDGGWRVDSAGPTAVARMRAAYFAGMRHVDETLSETLDALADLPPETVVVVTADHGEAFGEHGTLFHGRFLHDEYVHVPLVVRAKGRLPAGAEIAGCCSLVDVAPTVLELAGVPVPAWIGGRSLVPVARTRGAGRPVTSYVASPPSPGTLAGIKRRISVRDDVAAWFGTLDLRSGTWTEAQWFDRRTNRAETKPLTRAPRGASKELHAAIASARTSLEALYRDVSPPETVSGD